MSLLWTSAWTASFASQESSTRGESSEGQRAFHRPCLMCLRQALVWRCSSALSPASPLGTTHPNSGSFNASQDMERRMRAIMTMMLSIDTITTTAMVVVILVISVEQQPIKIKSKQATAKVVVFHTTGSPMLIHSIKKRNDDDNNRRNSSSRHNRKTHSAVS